MDEITTTIILPSDLHAEIKAIAGEQHRSMRKQMIHWLLFCVDRHRSRQGVGWWETEYDGEHVIEVREEE